jgi:hypothetical protein
VWAKRADEGNDGLWKRWAGAVMEEEGGRWGRVGQKGRMGRLAAWPVGPEVEKKSFRNKNWIFEFSKAL